MGQALAYLTLFIAQGAVFWMFLQLWRASWKSDKAREPWLSLLRTDVGRFLLPVYKWFSPVACVVTAFGMTSALLLMFAALLRN